MKKTTKRWLLAAGLLAISTGAFFLTHKRREESEILSETFSDGIEKTTIPTLFFHGYSGNGLTFTGMLNRLTRNEIGEESITLTVSPTGIVSEEGTWVAANNPLIKVVFEDNTNQEWQQAEWIQGVLNYLSETYQIAAVNLLGHSMGGVSIMRYLTLFGEEGSDVTVNKVITIGSPFNDFNEDSRDVSEITLNGPEILAPRYTEYAENFQRVPKATDYLTIAGDINGDNTGDGTVPLGSVVAISHLFTAFGLKNEFIKVTGRLAQHTLLHENREVDRLVIDFLWYHNQKNN